MGLQLRADGQLAPPAPLLSGMAPVVSHSPVYVATHNDQCIM